MYTSWDLKQKYLYIAKLFAVEVVALSSCKIYSIYCKIMKVHHVGHSLVMTMREVETRERGA